MCVFLCVGNGCGCAVGIKLYPIIKLFAFESFLHVLAEAVSLFFYTEIVFASFKYSVD